MNPEAKTKHIITFLSGGGEMGDLTRNKDWSSTPIGPPETWPQSLRTVLNILLNSRFPMFLWWGPELICFYNDAYRPSLGQNGKHPDILGMPAKEAWPEIWDIIKPLIDTVLNKGESTWSEDQLIPIFRNGKLEDVYWTFSYSPVQDEKGKISGVLVTCNETTAKVNTLKFLEDSNRRYYSQIMQAPVAMCVLKEPQHIVKIANERMLELIGRTSEEVLEKRVFEIIYEAREQGLEQLFDHVFLTGEKVATERPIELLRDGTITTVYIDFVCEAFREADGTRSGIVVVATDVTEKVIARKLAEENEKKFRDTIKQIPLGVTILRGPRFIVEMANETYLRIVDKKENDFKDKSLFDSLPEVREVVEPLLTNVLNTGVAFHAKAFPVKLNRYGKEELTYFDFVYHPLKGDNGEITGIIVVASEVTASIEAQHLLEQNEEHFRHLVMQSPIPMTIFNGKDFIIEMANNVMFEKIWRKKPADVIGKSILEVFPELNDQKYPALLKNVMDTGKTYTEKDAVAYVQGDDGMQKFYLDFEYKPLFGTDKEVVGIMVTVNDTTEKVETRQRIEENEEKLNLVIGASDLGTWELDLKTDKISYSARALEILGCKSGEVPSHEEVLKRLHPKDREKRDKAMQDAMITGTLNYETRMFAEDKSLRWFQNRGKVIYDEQKVPVMMIGTLRDITEQKTFEEKLLRREQRFRLLADSMPQFVWTADGKGMLSYFNPAMQNYSGLSSEQMSNMGWVNLIHPEEREENLLRWTQSIKTGREFLIEHRMQSGKGEYRWFRSYATPQRDEAGTIHMWVGTSSDIQEQKVFAQELEKRILDRTMELGMLNEELIKSEERYHLMVGEIQDYAIIFLNEEGVIENWNKGAEKIKGYSAHEIVGQHFSIFYTDKDRENDLPKRLLGEAIRNGRAVNEGLRVRKDKSLFWASVVITAIHDESDTVIGFSKITHDLTEKKRAEDRLKLYAFKLEEKNRELERMNAELQSFAYISSHDLQEPLRKIQTFASRINEKEFDNLSESGRDYFERMRSAAKRMQTLIQDLLTYSRTSTSEIVFSKVNMNELVNEIKTDLKETLAEKNATLISDNLQEVSVVPFQFRQLLDNLISNALKFSRPDVPPVITIKDEIKDGSGLGNSRPGMGSGYYHLSIADNGIGFDPQYRERIFEVFQRLHGKNEYSGTGIGLAIVKKIVENHHGLIEASSEPGKGTRFDIYLPVQ